MSTIRPTTSFTQTRITEIPATNDALLLKKEICLSSRQILRFFCRRTCCMYIYLYIDVAMCLMALVEILRITLLIIEKCKRHSFTKPKD